jgi:hypothetical protein
MMSLCTGLSTGENEYPCSSVGGWTVYVAPDGLPTFIPPPRIDPDQKPQRDRYHRRE